MRSKLKQEKSNNNNIQKDKMAQLDDIIICNYILKNGGKENTKIPEINLRNTTMISKV